MLGTSPVITIILVCCCGYAYSNDIVDIGHQNLTECSNKDIVLSWMPPPSDEMVKNATLRFTVGSSNENTDPRKVVVISKSGKDAWTVTHVNNFKGRIFDQSLTEFLLRDIRYKDTGIYELEVNGKNVTYIGHSQLQVYTAETTWPSSVGETSAETSAGGSTQYRFTFSQPAGSPARGVRVYARDTTDAATDTKECFFEKSTLCDILFTADDLHAMSGAVHLDVQPIFRSGTPSCVHDFKLFYNLVFNMPSEKRISAVIVVFIVVGVIIVLVGVVVVSHFAMKYRNKQNETVPLARGLSFVRFCTTVIEKYKSPNDLRGIYSTRKPQTQVSKFIEVYQKTKGSPGEDYANERVLLSSAVVTFLKGEKSAWLPLSVQQSVTQGETYTLDTYGGFDVATIRHLLCDSDRKDRMDRTRRDILEHLLNHFKRVIHDREVLETQVVPSLFKEVTAERSQIKSPGSENSGLEYQTTFVWNLIGNVSMIFSDSQIELPENAMRMSDKS